MRHTVAYVGESDFLNLLGFAFYVAQTPDDIQFIRACAKYTYTTKDHKVPLLSTYLLRLWLIVSANPKHPSKVPRLYRKTRTAK